MSHSKMNSRTRFGNVLRSVLLGGASTLAVGAFAAPALAQSAAATTGGDEEIVVTGIRASLQNSMDIKRNASGVVDAISAEDIGKFPDTNLAESLQRITGVTINRVNGEGAEVTVRGFGGGYNLVTYNGRTMPTAYVATIGGDQSADGAHGTSRSFNFENLASEGVSALEVYKTGRAAVPSGGLGATIDIHTVRPLDRPGTRGTVEIQAMSDQYHESGDTFTPGASGLFSWTNDAGNFGVAVFGNYFKRDSSSVAGTANDWNVMPYSVFQAKIATGGVVHNAPSNPNQLVAFANDSRYHLMQDEEERTNGQVTLQFRPMETLTLTADFLYADDKQDEQRTDQANWFNQHFDVVTFDGNPTIDAVQYMHETENGVKDAGFEQQYRGTENRLTSIGFNAAWDVSDNFRVTFDAHSSEGKSLPNNPMGVSSTMVSIAYQAVAAESVDWSSGFPVQAVTYNDCIRGNCNGVVDLGDVGSQVGRTTTSAQTHKIDEFRLDGDWSFEGGNHFTIGADYRTSKMHQTSTDTYQTLGDWGVNNVGDVAAFAPGIVSTYCLDCLFHHYDPGLTGGQLTAFRANAVSLYQALSSHYPPAGVSGFTDNEVDEDIYGAYAQMKLETDFGGLATHILAGLRYEYTSVSSASNVLPVLADVWKADNDFQNTVGTTGSTFAQDGGYSDVLPSFDVSVDLRDDLVGRVSFSKTIARPNYQDMFVAPVANNYSPNNPTYLGAHPTGSIGNADLKPLDSDNFDVSLEWYYDQSSYLSVGFYEKRVTNFIGTGQVTQNLFGLHDPSSGAPGTRSGAAVAALNGLGQDITAETLFTMTALIDQLGSTAAAVAAYTPHITGTQIDQAFIDATFGAYDVTADPATDPLLMYDVTTPINQHDARLYGWEIAWQHFFGDSGFGVAANYTTVSGDVGIDPGADPSVNQFALLGLSDSANATLIYDKYGLSARLAYTWRDTYLAQVNRGNGKSPVNVAARDQVDLNVTYDLTDHFQLSFDGINLTAQPQRSYGRTPIELWYAQELGARYTVGARYRF
ncbi:MAG TPA: TonB-dependent receptor [Caulobacterales bacterium]|nr:TonB-dependent receptor [Caulobacterales bacterium]